MSRTIDRFLLWEQSSRDSIDVKRIYIDMAGDLITGIMLSQIIYWNLPDKAGQTRLRVNRDGRLWLAKSYKDWWAEIRLSEKQARRAIARLKELGLIATSVWKFAGVPTTHIAVNWDNFMAAHRRELDRLAERREGGGDPSTCPPGQPDLPPRASPPVPRGRSYTETTTEITSENPDTRAAPAPQATPSYDSGPPKLSTYSQYREALGRATNVGKPRIIEGLIETHFPANETPSSAYIAKTAKGVGGYDRLLDILWRAMPRQPTGDVLRYALWLHKQGNGLNKGNGGNGQESQAISYQEALRLNAEYAAVHPVDPSAWDDDNPFKN